jgi:hypothetical protein
VSAQRRPRRHAAVSPVRPHRTVTTLVTPPQVVIAPELHTLLRLSGLHALGVGKSVDPPVDSPAKLPDWWRDEMNAAIDRLPDRSRGGRQIKLAQLLVDKGKVPTLGAGKVAAKRILDDTNWSLEFTNVVADALQIQRFVCVVRSREAAEAMKHVERDALRVLAAIKREDAFQDRVREEQREKDLAAAKAIRSAESGALGIAGYEGPDDDGQSGTLEQPAHANSTGQRRRRGRAGDGPAAPGKK